MTFVRTSPMSRFRQFVIQLLGFGAWCINFNENFLESRRSQCSMKDFRTSEISKQFGVGDDAESPRFLLIFESQGYRVNFRIYPRHSLTVTGSVAIAAQPRAGQLGTESRKSASWLTMSSVFGNSSERYLAAVSRPLSRAAQLFNPVGR